MRARDLSRPISGFVVGNDYLKPAARPTKSHPRVGNRTQQPREQSPFVVDRDDERDVRLHGYADVPPNAYVQRRAEKASRLRMQTT